MPLFPLAVTQHNVDSNSVDGSHHGITIIAATPTTRRWRSLTHIIPIKHHHHHLLSHPHESMTPVGIDNLHESDDTEFQRRRRQRHPSAPASATSFLASVEWRKLSTRLLLVPSLSTSTQRRAASTDLLHQYATLNRVDDNALTSIAGVYSLIHSF